MVMGGVINWCCWSIYQFNTSEVTTLWWNRDVHFIIIIIWQLPSLWCCQKSIAMV